MWLCVIHITGLCSILPGKQSIVYINIYYFNLFLRLSRLKHVHPNETLSFILKHNFVYNFFLHVLNLRTCPYKLYYFGRYTIVNCILNCFSPFWHLFYIQININICVKNYFNKLVKRCKNLFINYSLNKEKMLYTSIAD